MALPKLPSPMSMSHLPNPMRREREKLPTEIPPGMLEKVGTTGLNAAIGVANVLNLPGSMVLDVATGRNPFDQLLTPFSDKNRTDGRQLLRDYGLVDQQDNWHNFGKGLAVDILTDPLTYAGGLGALSKGGKVASKAGLLKHATKLKPAGKRVAQMTTSLDDLLKVAPEATESAEAAAKAMGTSLKKIRHQKLRGAGSLGIPFTGIERPLVYADNPILGSAALKVASGLDKAGAFAKQLAPVRFARMLGDASVQGKYKLRDQQLAELAFNNNDQFIGNFLSKGDKQFSPSSVAANTFHHDALEKMVKLDESFSQEFGRQLPQGTDSMEALQKIVRMTTELGGDVDAAVDFQKLPASQMSDTLRSGIKSAVDELNQNKDSLFRELQKRGGKVSHLDPDGNLDFMQHAVRYGGKRGLKAGPGRVAAVTTDSMKRRNKALRALPAEVINSIATDPAIRSAKDPAQEILARYGKWFDPGQYKYAKSFKDRNKHAKALAKWLKGKKDVNVFQNAYLDDLVHYTQQSHRTIRNYDAIHEFFGSNMLDARTATQPAVTLEEAFKRIGMNKSKALDHFADIRKLNRADAKNILIPTEVVDAAAGMIRPHQVPEWAERIGRAVDEITRIFKQSVTVQPFFPSFFTRNLVSGQVVNLTAGGHVKTPLDIGRYVASVGKAMTRRNDPALMRELRATNLIGGDVGLEGVEVLRSGKTLAPSNPLSRQVLRSGIDAASDPTRTILAESRLANLPGVKQARQAFGASTAVGSEINAHVEWMNRVAPYLFLREKGFSMEEAAKQVKKMQFDYSHLAPFERRVLKRAIPFYSFSRRLASLTADELIQRPGGAFSRTFRELATTRDDDPTTPAHIREGFAFPVPASIDDGTKSYMTGLGLAQENIIDLMNRPMKGAFGMMTPMAKVPIEQVTGQSLFFDKPLAELNPSMGQAVANIQQAAGVEKEDTNPYRFGKDVEYAATNTPLLGRAISSTRTLFDPRKSPLKRGVNYLLGMKFTDVSPEQQERELRLTMERELDRMNASRTATYVPQYLLDRLSPEQRAEAERYNYILKILKNRNR